ncbi:MAG TPA: histidine kinase [Acidimicrobiales bacterium]
MSTVHPADVHPGRVIGGVIFAAVGLGFLLESLGAWTVDLVYLWPLVLIGIGISFLLGRARRIKLEEDRSAKIAVAEERVRIARELHDIVAHGVSLMTIQIAAARRVAVRQPEAADEALAAAEQAGRQSLTELRSLLAVLRSADASLGEARFDGSPPFAAANGRANAGGAESARAAAAAEETAPTSPLPRLTDIPDLVENLQSAGLDVALEIDGLLPVVSPAIELTAYRVVQESLTNVVRHAPGARARVIVSYDAADIDIVVQDNGAGLMATRPAADGHGLLGMRERVAAVGGSVDAGPRGDAPGWQVEARLPVLAVDPA